MPSVGYDKGCVNVDALGDQLGCTIAWFGAEDDQEDDEDVVRLVE